MTAIRRYVVDDHARLDELLTRSTASPELDLPAFERFRAGLLRHIGIEEKILLPELRRRTGQPHPSAARLRLDHAAIAALMVPTPDHALVSELRSILEDHNAAEEAGDGLYVAFDALPADEAAALMEKLSAVREPPLAKHFDGSGSVRTAEAALALAGRAAARAAERNGRR
jgi:Hemerythrin HHE cation binding domain